MNSSISLFGLGYVGTVSAACFAHKGHKVVGVDVSRDKVDMLGSGKSPIVEARVSELIAEYCGGMQDGHQLYAYLPGGASGGILPASMGDIPLDFDTLQPYGCFIGSAAVIILSQHDKARDAALNLMQFFEHESCGQCTPCRVGTAKAAQLMAEPKWNQGLLEELSVAMADASICGLGQAAPNPIRCVAKHFPHEV